MQSKAAFLRESQVRCFYVAPTAPLQRFSTIPGIRLVIAHPEGSLFEFTR